MELQQPMTNGPEMPEEKYPEETLRKLWSINGDGDAIGASL